MQLKTLYFNRTLFRKNLTRFWPLWAVPSFLGALFPLVALTEWLRNPNLHVDALDLTGVYYEVVAYGVPVISLCYAVLVALAVWSYLFNARSVGLMHTLPLRREGLFLTGVVSGMVMMLIPYAVTGGLAIIIFACFGAVNPTGILVTILCVAGESLFYFATATLVAFVTGNLFAMPVFYGILHFFAAGMDLLVSLFAGGFLLGVQAGYSGAVEFLSPTIYLMNKVRAEHQYEERFVEDLVHGTPQPDGRGYYRHELVDITLENGWLIAVYALVGVVLLALACRLYLRRSSESAGDVVAVGWMKPLFRYGVTVCGAMAGGLALYGIFWSGIQRSSNYYEILPLMFFMLFAGILAYFAASMLLAKSFRVFRGCWRGLGLAVACVAAVCGTLHFDLLGVETRVPAANEIESLEFRVADNTYVLTPEEHPEVLEQVRKLHLTIAQDADYIIDMEKTWRQLSAEDRQTISAGNYIRLDYILKDGKTLSRRYHVSLTEERLHQSGTYDYLLDTLINSEAMKALRLHLADDYIPNGGYLWTEKTGNHYDLGSREAAAILAAVGLDMTAGNWGDHFWFARGDGDRYAIGLDLSFQRYMGNSEYRYDDINIVLRPEMTHTIACLLELDLVKREDLVTYAQLHPEDYAAEQQMLFDKYGYLYEATAYPAYDPNMDPNSFPATEVIVRGSADVSVGIIGGTDGPTAVVVS